jgi:serine/threonine protein kinase
MVSISCSGYLPPEFIERNIISNKLDIFSLGVIVIKIMTGRSGYYKLSEMPPQQFIQLVWKILFAFVVSF